MSRYIDVDKIKITAERGKSIDELIFIPMIDVQKCIDATPTADVVEVVRCKDCKHTQKTQYGTIICLMNSALCSVDDMHFCSYGERRAERCEKD